jgi:hypothetical protein
MGGSGSTRHRNSVANAEGKKNVNPTPWGGPKPYGETSQSLQRPPNTFADSEENDVVIVAPINFRITI